MIRISQENLFAGRYSGIDQSTGVSFPSFENVARTFGMEYKSIDDYESLAMDISEVLASDGPILIDVRMAQTQKYFPRLATSTMPDGSFISPPLEDLDPKISLEQLRNLLGYEPTASSVAIRKGVN